MRPRLRVNKPATLVALAVALFWLAVGLSITPEAFGAQADEFKPGDLATTTEPVRTCVRVHSVDTGPGARTYVWATATDDARRTYHVPAAELVRGCP